MKVTDVTVVIGELRTVPKYLEITTIKKAAVYYDKRWEVLEHFITEKKKKKGRYREDCWRVYFR